MISLLLERKHRSSLQARDDCDRKEEEAWPLKDVIFVEDVKNAPVGKVIKACLFFYL